MNFQEAYEYLLSFHNLPRLEYMNDSKKTSVYLKRTQFFLDILENPEKKIPHYIHITGTSGKGSVTNYLHSILQAAKKKVGSSCSPHPTYITERWKIGNRYMTKKEFVSLVEILKPKLDLYLSTTPYDMLSFFEITEVLGILFFVQNKVEWVVMEVACGGRNDATNIIPHKDAAVITNIGLDHVGIIGNNKKEIGYEKAGIIKNCPVFTTEKDKNIREIFENEAKKTGSKIIDLHNEKYKIISSTFDQTEFVYKTKKFCLPMFGDHQIKNAIICIELARQLKIPDTAIYTGLKNANQPLRLEVINKKPLTILDGAHNADKIASTVEAIQGLKLKSDIYLIVGFSYDKDLKPLVSSLAKLKPTMVFCTHNTNNPTRKVANPRQIQKLFQTQLHCSKGIVIRLDPLDAWKEALNKAKPKDLILVTGSIFLSGEIRGQFDNLAKFS